MSYRPTISVYINGHIADIGYYRNWDDKDLFYEAFAIAALFYKCKSIPEYNAKKFGRQKVYYSVEPEIFENTEGNLKFFESHIYKYTSRTHYLKLRYYDSKMR